MTKIITVFLLTIVFISSYCSVGPAGVGSPSFAGLGSTTSNAISNSSSCVKVVERNVTQDLTITQRNLIQLRKNCIASCEASLEVAKNLYAQHIASLAKISYKEIAHNTQALQQHVKSFTQELKTANQSFKEFCQEKIGPHIKISAQSATEKDYQKVILSLEPGVQREFYVHLFILKDFELKIAGLEDSLKVNNDILKDLHNFMHEVQSRPSNELATYTVPTLDRRIQALEADIKNSIEVIKLRFHREYARHIVEVRAVIDEREANALVSAYKVAGCFAETPLVRALMQTMHDLGFANNASYNKLSNESQKLLEHYKISPGQFEKLECNALQHHIHASIGATINDLATHMELISKNPTAVALTHSALEQCEQAILALRNGTIQDAIIEKSMLDILQETVIGIARGATKGALHSRIVGILSLVHPMLGICYRKSFCGRIQNALERFTQKNPNRSNFALIRKAFHYIEKVPFAQQTEIIAELIVYALDPGEQLTTRLAKYFKVCEEEEKWDNYLDGALKGSQSTARPKAPLSPTPVADDIVEVRGIRVRRSVALELERQIDEKEIQTLGELEDLLRQHCIGHDKEKLPTHLDYEEADARFMAAEKSNTFGVWPMPKSGWRINGLLFTQRALEAIAPRTSQIRRELSERAAMRRLTPETPEYIRLMEPLAIPPSAIFTIINSLDGTKVPGPDAKEEILRYRYKDIIVDTHERGDVLDVFKVPSHLKTPRNEPSDISLAPSPTPAPAAAPRVGIDDKHTEAPKDVSLEMQQRMERGKIRSSADRDRQLQNNQDSYNAEKLPTELNDKEADGFFAEAQKATTFGVWPMPQRGWRINGTLFTQRALECIAPKTPCIVDELCGRAIKRRFPTNSPEYVRHLNPLAILPSKILTMLRELPGTVIVEHDNPRAMRIGYTVENISIITDGQGDVLDVCKNS